MDQLDRYIESIVKKEITLPENLDEIIKEAISSAKCKKRIRAYKIKKTILTSIIAVFCISGVGVAGYITYEKIWKDPEEYTYEEVQGMIADGNNVENKENLITEEEAKQNATTIMKNLGYNNEKIQSITLQKDINNNNEPFYNIRTSDNENEGIAIKLSAYTGELNSFTNNNFQNINSKKNEITNEQAKEYSDEILKKIGFNESNYKLTECTEQQISYTNQIKNLWVAKYYKIYDGIYNPYEVLTSNFVVNNDKIEISSIFETKKGNYDNNPMVITEEEAIQIATSKEKELTNKEIENTSTEIGIRKMNKYIFKLENNILPTNSELKEEESIAIKENNTRKVWMINIYHKNQEIKKITDMDILKSKDKAYYIDITTGEILGGEKINT